MKESQGKETESLPAKVLELIFFLLPLSLMRAGIFAIGKIPNRAIRIMSRVVCGVAYGVSFVSVRPLVEHLKTSDEGLAIRLSVYYGFYLILLGPLFFCFAYFKQREGEKLYKNHSAAREPDSGQMRSDRFESSSQKVYLGSSFHSRKPIFLTNEQRLMHAEVVGSTGTGKTESVLLPMLAHDVANGKGAIVIDGKGDLELYDRILYIVKHTKREQDFFFFSLTHPGLSNTYNPLLRGNATELKDKLIGSMLWSEDFYRRMAEQATLTLLNAIVARNEIVQFRNLHTYLTDLGALKALVDMTQEPDLKSELLKMSKQFKNNTKFLSGLTADLYLMSQSEFSGLVNVERPAIDLLDVYKQGKIVYFQLDLQGYGDTAKRLGRMILQDIRNVSSYVQAYMRESKRSFFPIFVDDAASFLDLNFIDFLNKARASKFAIMLLHQSIGDLVIRRDTSFQQQILENTNVKVILRQDDPESVEKLTKIGGTRRTVISTYQTEDRLLGKGFTGTGSIREGQAFRVDPDLIRALKRGEAIVIWKTPSFHTDYVKLDFFGHPGVSYVNIKEPSSTRRIVPDIEVAKENPQPARIDPDEYLKHLEGNSSIRL